MPGKHFLLAMIAGTALLTARPAEAVILYLKDQPKPIRGFFVREDEKVIVLEELHDDGTTSQRTVARAEIEDIIRSVSEERLEALRPENPDAYREYAEELAEKRKDPDAQVTGIRLYQIAAHLEPARLGRSCLLGMVPLARTVDEQRRFRAVAYLLDPTHDTQLLKVPRAVPKSSSDLDERQAEFLLKPLRLLREGKRREALAQGRRSKLKERLPLLTNAITYEEFETACELTCPHCQRGRQECPECKEKKFVLRGLTRVACPTCGARGDILCPQCGGEFKNNRLSSSLLKRIVRLELDWLPAEEAAEEESTPIRPQWSRTVQQKQLTVALPLSLESLTDFDPRQCLYRDGKWTD